MLRIFKYFRLTDWLIVLLVAVLVVLQVWLELKMPDYMRDITVNLTSKPNFAMSEIWVAGGFMLLCALGSLAGAIATVFLSTRISADFAERLRQMMFERVEGFSASEINRFSTPSLITRTTNDVTQVQMLVGMGTNLLIRAPVMAVWAIAKISTKNWEFMAVAVGAIVAMFILVGFLVGVALPKFRKIQGLTDNINRLTRENLMGIRVIRAYNAEDYQEEKFEKANEEMTKTQLFANRAMQVMMPGMTLIMSGLTLAITLIGAVLVNAAAAPLPGALEAEIPSANLLFGEMITFSQYAMQAIMAFVMLVMVFILLPRAAVSARRILEVMDTEISIKDGAGAHPREHGTVEFKKVSFKYPDAEENVLDDISFSVKSGETIAFIGSTGSGKSTLINLIPRFYDVTHGTVLVDGVNVKEYKLADLNNRIGYIAQKGVIFAGTVHYNIAFGESAKDITDKDVLEAVDTAQAKEFVDALDSGIEANVARGGTDLSGGQKQRLSIARALAKKPEILIFDDSFSALDYKTDRNLRAALKKQNKGVTSLIVAQRIGTIKDADKIIVLDNGRMVGCGVHTELLQSCPVYREIALSQLSKEELEK